MEKAKGPLTMTDRFHKLLETVSEPDKTELTLAYNGRIQAMKAYQDKPGKATKDDYDAARALFEETVDRLYARYFPQETQAPDGDRFKNRIQALNWLQAQGYKVSQGKFYGDCKDGFPAIHKDGTLSRFQVMQYGQQLDIEKRSNPVDSLERERDEARKVKADADKAEMQADEMRRELDKKWILREDAEAHEAALMGILKDTFRHRVYLDHAHLVLTAGGDPGRDSEFALALQGFVDAAFNEVADGKRFEVEFEEGEFEDEE